MEEIVVFGAGGHAKVVLDILAQIRRYHVVGLLDDSAELEGTLRWGVKVLGGRDRLAGLREREMTRLIVALGNNRHRHSVYEDAVKAGFELVTVIHPSAQLGGRVKIGSGSLVVAGAIINVDTVIGENAIINTGATVDHDCRIGAHVHLSPGVHLAGNVTVGELTHIGIGAVVLPNLIVGRGCVIGGGAVVLEDVPDRVVVAGNPARPVRTAEGGHGV